MSSPAAVSVPEVAASPDGVLDDDEGGAGVGLELLLRLPPLRLLLLLLPPPQLVPLEELEELEPTAAVIHDVRTSAANTLVLVLVFVLVLPSMGISSAVME